MVRDFYGFSGRPFQLIPDPACYFDSLSQRRALSCLGYSLAQGEGFVVVTGDSGVGKSTLIGHVLATIDQAVQTTATVVYSQPAGEAIIPIIARAFGRPEKAGNVADLDAIERFLHDEARSNRRCLLVVDDAHNLSIAALDVLRQLSASQFGGDPVLQILLAGQAELRDRLQSHPGLEPLRQRVIASLHLDPFEAGEVERYIHHRLTCVGWSGTPTFAPSVFAEIHAATAGVPARINQIANRLLLLAAVERQSHIDGGLLAQVLQDLRGGDAIPLAGPELKSRLEDTLARCESQIAELQRAYSQVEHGQNQDALLERLSSLEGRVIEQERTIRHTMTILIEWIERDEALRVAA